MSGSQMDILHTFSHEEEPVVALKDEGTTIL